MNPLYIFFVFFSIHWLSLRKHRSLAPVQRIPKNLIGGANKNATRLYGRVGPSVKGIGDVAACEGRLAKGGYHYIRRSNGSEGVLQ